MYLSIHPSVFLPVFLSIIFLSICLSIYWFICPSMYLSIYLFSDLFISLCLSTCLSIYLPIYRSIGLSVYLSIYLGLFLSTKIIFIWCSKMQPLSGNQGVERLKKCTPLWQEADFEVKMFKARHAGTIFGRWSVVLCGRGKGFCTLPQVNKTWGFVAVPKTLAGMGHLKKICKDACWVANAIQEIHESDILGSKTKSVFYILTSKSASRQNGAHFFWYVNFQKSAPMLRYF